MCIVTVDRVTEGLNIGSAMYSIIFIEFLLFHASRGERGAKHRAKCPEAPTESWPADVRSELRQILPIHIITVSVPDDSYLNTNPRLILLGSCALPWAWRGHLWAPPSPTLQTGAVSATYKCGMPDTAAISSPAILLIQYRSHVVES